MRVVVITDLTLDGVMQGPGRPDEDRSGGFSQGGWATEYHAMNEVGDVLDDAGCLLLGRRTFEDFLRAWPEGSDSPYKRYLDRIQKYVASRSIREPLPWKNSTLLGGDATVTVAELKKKPGKDMVVMGSGELVRSLMKRGLVDEFVLLIHPILLGTGKRLFVDGGEQAILELRSSKTTHNGVVIARYVPTGGLAEGRPGTYSRKIMDFDTAALFKALDVQRAARGINWTRVASEIWRMSPVLNSRRPHDHPISASTITGMAKRGNTTCQHVLAMLRWLGRPPESFIPGFVGYGGTESLPPCGPDRRLRWRLPKIYEAVKARREELRLTWRQAAREIGCTPSQLMGIRTARYAINMKLAMRITQWLGQPSSDFIYAAQW